MAALTAASVKTDSTTFLRRHATLIESIFFFAAPFLIYFIFIYNSDAASRKKESENIRPIAPLQIPETTAQSTAETAEPEGTAVTGAVIYFDEEVDTAIIAACNRAKKSIVAATYTLEESPLSNAIEQASARGVDVLVIAGKPASKTFRFPFTHVRGKGIFHEKFLIIDQELVVVSSRNLSRGGGSNSALVFEKAPLLAEILSAEAVSQSQGITSNRCKNGCRFEKGLLYTQPGKGCRAIKEALLSAKSRIELALYTITPGTPMMTGLKKVRKKGIPVSGIFDDWVPDDGTAVNKKAKDYLESLGADIRWDGLYSGNTRELFHHKFAVIDRRLLIFGSMNWTKSGCYKNRELVMTITDREWAKVFGNYLNSMRK